MYIYKCNNINDKIISNVERNKNSDFNEVISQISTYLGKSFLAVHMDE